MQVFYSNRIETLYHLLKENLFTNSQPFKNRTIIVPSPAIKSWLMLQMAKDPDLCIATAVNITYLDQTFSTLLRKYFFDPTADERRKPTQMLLALAIELEIRRVIDNRQFITPHEKTIWEPLFNYLKVTQNFNRKSQKRLVSLSETLSHLFLQYGNYSGKMVAEWETSPNLIHWQQFFWKKFFLKDWSYPYLELTKFKKNEKQEEREIHLFSMSHLSHLHHTFLTKISPFFPVNYYLMSPCQMFWSDILSDKESQRLQSFWKKQHVPTEQQIDLEKYLRDKNRLLANFGRLGREMTLQIEESATETREYYFLPQGIQLYPQYEEFLTEETLFDGVNQPFQMLQAVQSDMLLMRNPNKSNKISFSPKDSSFQVHVAPSRRREVEIAYDLLMGLIEKHQLDQDPIHPQDIIVMAPDITQYASFIKSIFGSDQSPLDFQVMDLETSSQSSLVQGFLHLLSLPYSRWDVTSILQLLDYTQFRTCLQLSSEDIVQIRHWTKESGASWGSDGLHRDELLKQSHCEKGIADSNPVGTWDHSFSRLIQGMIMTASEDPDAGAHFPLLPIENMEMTQSALLSKWILVVGSLREDLKAMTDGRTHTLLHWSLYLITLCEKYFGMNFHQENAFSDEEIIIATQIENLKEAAKFTQEEVFNFISIHKRLEVGFKQEKICYRESHLQSVRFCSMLPMRAIPAKVILLMGMDEGVFPKIDKYSSLNLMKSHPQSDYMPSQTDFDRFLFLEALLSARQYFVMSYQGYSPQDGKEQPPSLLVTEILEYLDGAYLLNENKPSEICVTKHPFYSFDQFYFTSDSSFKSYSISRYQSAVAHYHPEKKPSHLFFPDFTYESHSENKEEKQKWVIQFKQLSSFARNPLKTYFNETLGVYLRDKETFPEDNFTLSPLNTAFMKKEALKNSSKTILSLADKKGQLPTGLFKEVACRKFEDEVRTLKIQLADHGIQKLFDVELGELYLEPIQHEENWKFPPLIITTPKGKEIKVVGKVPEVSFQGLVIDSKDDKEKALKAWPGFLVLACLVEKYALPIKSQIIFIKNGKIKTLFSDPFVLLTEYLDYYFISLKNASPLIPEWTYDLIHSDSHHFEKVVEESLTNDFKPIYNHYLKWISRGNKLPNSFQIAEKWKTPAEQLYKDLYNHWYPSKSEKETMDE